MPYGVIDIITTDSICCYYCFALALSDFGKSHILFLAADG